MKTLDEVITALDACQRSACEKCPYYDPNVDICDDVAQADALHYLKEYQAILPLMPSLINTVLAVQKKGKTIG